MALLNVLDKSSFKFVFEFCIGTIYYRTLETWLNLYSIYFMSTIMIWRNFFNTLILSSLVSRLPDSGWFTSSDSDKLLLKVITNLFRIFRLFDSLDANTTSIWCCLLLTVWLFWGVVYRYGLDDCGYLEILHCLMAQQYYDVILISF